MKLLLFSNSTNAGESYLGYAKEYINNFLGDIKEVVFVPYAAVTFSYDEYEKKVEDALTGYGIKIRSVHRAAEPAKMVADARAIALGGGNTFRLLQKMQEYGLVEAIAGKVRGGTPFMGWSAGSNVACPTICTTNDMPIVEPQSFEAMGLLNFQINPHYIDANPAGHAGETRQQRIEEFLEVNRDITVAGLREGCAFSVEDGKISLIGSKTVRVFRYGDEPTEYGAADDLSFLLK